MGNNEVPQRSRLYDNPEYSYKQHIEHIVEDRLHENMWDRSNDINVQCIDKETVVLSGFVEVLGDKIEAETVVNSIDEITSIENKITIPITREYSDAEIQEQIINNLQSSIYSSHLMEVTPIVRGGIVNLRGEVETDWYKKHAEEIASNAYNVNQVVNSLKLRTLQM